MNGKDRTTSVTRLADLLDGEIDWEPRLRDQRWTPRRRVGWSGL